MSRKANDAKKVSVESYVHTDKKRVNNPPVGLVSPSTDPEGTSKSYTHDKHIDPFLSWAGKQEHLSFDVPTVSLHVHERTDPSTIIDAILKNNTPFDLPLFESADENPPLRKAIEFYSHSHNWSNRLIAGDSLLVMNSLLEKEGMAENVQTIYIDPPYGIAYRSNFQPFVDHTSGSGLDKDSDLTGEPEQIRAFRDTWELGIHSYLQYMRDRLLLSRDLLTESGSCFVQIGDDNVHRLGILMEEIFGAENRVTTISFATTSGSSSNTLPDVANYILWFAKNKDKMKFHQLYENMNRRETIEFFSSYAMLELEDGSTRKLSSTERFDPSILPKNARVYSRTGLSSQGYSTTGRSEPYVFDGVEFHCPPDSHWSVSHEGMDNLAKLGRLDYATADGNLRMKKYENEVPGRRINNLWRDQSYEKNKVYVVQSSRKVVQRCILMTSDPGDLVLDPTCGSGTTAFIAEQWGRRWITCDTSRIALTIAKQRLLTANFEYYQLLIENEGVGSGFNYKHVETVSAKKLAYNLPLERTFLHDQPFVDRRRSRITGPFTVEAVPAPTIRSLDSGNLEIESTIADSNISRTAPSVIQSDRITELAKTGIRARKNQHLRFENLEPLLGTKYLHAEGTALADDSNSKLIHIVVSFGPEYAPLSPQHVALAIEEARTLVPLPSLIVFAAFQFDSEAMKDIFETKWPGVELICVHMNADLLTDDLKKKSETSDSFWLIGQPDVRVKKIQSSENETRFIVSVAGFDYYDPQKGTVESGDTNRIAMWLLDTDYDGRSIYPRQIFLLTKRGQEDLRKLAHALRSVIDGELIEKYVGTESLPFTAGVNERAAVKIIDDRGIESIKVISLTP